jgi:NAD(P)-dependent dehydrogenase (short-subunit alcohol dehydrogenase family)
MTKNEGRVAFVTGAASGIGLGIARAFAAEGMKVMMADIEEEPLQKAVADIRAANGVVEGVVCDVGKIDSVRAAAEKTLEAFGKVHILVNNAGVGGGGETGEIPIEDWRWVVDVNLMGVVHGCETFVPLIKEHGEGGHIVNTSSMFGQFAGPGVAPYNATKFAVVGYSESMHAELEQYDIGVSVLCPGWVQTQLMSSDRNHPQGSDRPVASEDLRDAISEEIDKGMSPETLGKWVLENIEKKALYIFTHPKWKDIIELRSALLLQAYDDCINSELVQSDEGAMAELVLPVPEEE